MTLTQKEQDLLKDLEEQEKLCIDKYGKSAAKAVDPQLKGLFTQIAQTEQKHLNCLNGIKSGNAPSCSGGETAHPTFSAFHSVADTPDKKNDCYLCSDNLTGEKHVSHLYDTCIFEFKDEQTRTALGAIQKDEQCHGKMIYDYMQANSMYC